MIADRNNARVLAVWAAVFSAFGHLLVGGVLALAAWSAPRGIPGGMAINTLEVRAPVSLSLVTANPLPVQEIAVPIPVITPPPPLPTPVVEAAVPIPIPTPPPPVVTPAIVPVMGHSMDNSSPASSPVEHRAPAGASWFALPSEARSVVYVLDRSASMGAFGRLDRAKAEILASLRAQPASSRFQIIAYERTASTVAMSAGYLTLLPAGPEQIALAERFLRELRPVGGNDHGLALGKALALRPDAIVFLTDADDLTTAEVQRATQANVSKATIHAVGFGPAPAGDPSLERLARLNRGVCRRVD